MWTPPFPFLALLPQGSAASAQQGAVVITGNDGVGKSTLLATARRGQVLPTHEQDGCTFEVLSLDSGQITVCDVGSSSPSSSGTGAWMFLRALEANGTGDANAIVHVIRASDRRLWSSLWELYSIVKSFRCPHLPVCVVVLRDDATWPRIAALAEREALPPGSLSLARALSLS
jgi:GTPase Era involved in 16S rRNA processing